MVAFLVIRDDDQRIRHGAPRIAPAVFQARLEEQAVPGFEPVRLAFHYVFQLSAHAENKFMPGVEHTCRAAAGPVFQGDHERHDPPGKLFAAQPFP